MTDNKRAADDAAARVDEAMVQAQVFASAWSLVGGTFDFGNALNDAEVEKQALRALIRDLLAAERQAALSSRADGGKGEAVALWAAFAPEGNLLAHSKLRPGLSDILNWEPLYRAAPQSECAPLPKQEALGEPFQTVLNENRWNLYAEEKPKGMTGCGKCDDDPAECAWHQQCQAECAPREAQPVAVKAAIPEGDYDLDWIKACAPTPERAQPVGPRTTLNFDGTVDITCAHCGGNGCFACLSANAACASNERADADTSGAKMTNAQIDEIGVKAGLMERVGKKQVALAAELSATEMRAAIRTLLATPASQERADAGKDAALTDDQIREIWLRETGFNEQAAPFAILEFARAILAANKEPK
jgi:hypothetical protein